VMELNPREEQTLRGDPAVRGKVMNLASRSWNGESAPNAAIPLAVAKTTPRPGKVVMTPSSRQAHEEAMSQEYESTLMELVVQLEFHRSKLEHEILNRRHDAALDSTLRIADYLGRFTRLFLPAVTGVETESSIGPDRLIPLMGDVAALRARMISRWTWKSILLRLKRKPDPRLDEWEKEFRQCLLMLHEYVQDSFARFTTRFPSSAQARGWVSTAATYLADLKRIINELPT
jgi:hypothetical protein